jgi:aminoglycoside phosphotransferase (APT) family kinase protein
MPPDTLVGSSGVLVVVGEREVLRLGIGTGRVRVEAQRDALEAILGTGAAVASRIPHVLGAGTSGLASWTLERRLTGSAARVPLAPELLRECVDFLVDLHSAGRELPGDDGLSAGAETIAAAAGRHAAEVRGLAGLLDEALAKLPRGFAHGDFWHGNLLVDAGRLTGVVDWAAAGAGRLPLLDLLHLRASEAREEAGETLGWAVMEELLPWSRSGGDDVSGAYCRRLGLDADRALLERLVGAYWLTGVARELGDFDRAKGPAEDPAWVAANVDRPLRALLDLSSSGA